MNNDTVGRAQVRQIITLFGKAGIKDRSTRIRKMQAWTGRPIYSTTNLMPSEADYVIRQIKVMLEGDDGFPVPPPPEGVV